MSSRLWRADLHCVAWGGGRGGTAGQRSGLGAAMRR